ncbi:pimeloyl-ACP methyl ester carboxylesterase [Povalibacter uvarum]|uniref:Pimeloyl-ACP methyl ester carboxylesterase n=1 Tax=Povalibacter uvarum TaxID=732238 RepID=A0A841HHM1_9GAMM|nr:alpha/beta fold hydrolase [Povalibacter uvarum]MBB6092467.1 pimeloyl-ACP methyl ester carboxylesterase [Povalibacter uvarum]
MVSARSGQALPDPIVPLMGGPGEEAISAAAYYSEQFASLLDKRDLVLIDQRGTGRSSALNCDMYRDEEAAENLQNFFPPSAVRRCARQHASADLSAYSYLRFADDLEYVRRKLGYGPMNLFAGSYGTRAAQIFLKTHPQSARTAYLGSVVPLDVVIPLPMAKALQDVFEKTFGACAADSECHAAFPNLRAEFNEVLTRLDKGVKVSVPGGAVETQLPRGRFVEWLRARLYRAETAAQVPWFIHQAYVGNWNPIVETILSDTSRRDSAESPVSFGLFFAIACSGDIAFLEEASVAPQSQGTFLGDYRVRQQEVACKEWPTVRLPANYRDPVRTSVPTLFVSGDTDPATPLWFTERVAPGFTERAEVVLRNRGHTEWSDCVGKLYEQFVRGGQARGIDGASCGALRRPPFRIR